MRDVFIRTLEAAAAQYPRLVLITGDLGFGVLANFAARFPRQYLNIGVAEQNMTGVAAGLALEGRVVFTYSIGNFPTLRCLEQIRNDVCYHKANVKIVSVGGGMSYGAVGMSHHATEDLAILRALPNLLVLAPADEWETAEATRAIIDHAGPAYLRLDKSVAPDTAVDRNFRIGRIRTVREGSDLTLVATGGIVGETLTAATLLAQRGIEARILSVHTLKPLDTETLIKAAAETGAVITVEEHTVCGGLGGAVAECLLESETRPRRFLRLGLHSRFSSDVGSQSYLRRLYGLDAHSIADAAINVVGVPVLAGVN